MRTPLGIYNGGPYAYARNDEFKRYFLFGRLRILMKIAFIGATRAGACFEVLIESSYKSRARKNIITAPVKLERCCGEPIFQTRSLVLNGSCGRRLGGRRGEVARGSGNLRRPTTLDR
jgi:hypothetical protein